MRRIFAPRGGKRISLRLSPFALAVPTIISAVQSKIFLFPRSIDSRHLAPIRQVVICVEGVEISIVAMRLPPGITELEGTRLKRRGRIKEKKTFIKKGEDWRADIYVLSLDERQPLLSIVERVGSTTSSCSVVCACRGQREGERETRRNTRVAFFSNQHSSWARVTLDRLFARPRVSSSAGITFLRAPNRASVTSELNEMPFFFPFSPFLFHPFSSFSLFFHSHIYIPVTQCIATPRLSAF